MSLLEYAEQVFLANKGERICSFEYQNEKYWLKQPEKLSGIWQILKPNPKQAFLNEIKTLQELHKQNAPVPFLEVVTDNYFVTKNFGSSVANYLRDESLAPHCHEEILIECTKSLIKLHEKNLIHGRPAVRDMLWQDGEITFIDFETHKGHSNLPYQKARDILIFIHSLCRELTINKSLIQKVIQFYKMNCNKNDWKNVKGLLLKYRWLYYLLLPIKPFAKTDLIALYRLFENIKEIES